MAGSRKRVPAIIAYYEKRRNCFAMCIEFIERAIVTME